MKLEHWSLVADDPYKAPELQRPSLRGEVYGNPNFDDGTIVITSTVMSVDVTTQSATTRSGSVYELGEVDPEWEKLFPNAKERFFKK